MAKKEKWFHPRRETGWKKFQSAKTRRSKIYSATDKKLSQYERNIQAGRMIKSLANVNKRSKIVKGKKITYYTPTGKIANTDADYFFGKAKSLEEKGKRIVRKRKRVKGWG